MAKNSKNDAHHDEHRPNVKLYMAIGAALFVLTVVTVWISKFHLPKGPAVALGLFVALIKGTLVAAVFMHLWGESKVVLKGLLITVGGAALLVLPLIDARMVFHRLTHPMPVAEQHPAAHGEEHSGAHIETVTETIPAKVAKPAAKPAKRAHK